MCLGCHWGDCHQRDFVSPMRCGTEHSHPSLVAAVWSGGSFPTLSASFPPAVSHAGSSFQKEQKAGWGYQSFSETSSMKDSKTKQQTVLLYAWSDSLSFSKICKKKNLRFCVLLKKKKDQLTASPNDSLYGFITKPHSESDSHLPQNYGLCISIKKM